MSRVVVVTGAGSGLGADVARRISEEGGTVVVVDQDGARADAVVAGLSGPGLAIEADISDADAVANCFTRTVQTFGTVTGLHANAGIAGPLAGITDVGVDAFRQVMEVNVTGTFLCVQAAAAAMLDSGTSGSIVITSSALGIMGAIGAAPYSMSKHALIGLARCAALEFGRQGIRVNAICPGYIDTPLMRPTEAIVGQGDQALGRKLIEQSIAVGRYAHVSEVSALATWLLSDEASYVNGSYYSVDAGLASGLDVSADES